MSLNYKSNHPFIPTEIIHISGARARSYHVFLLYTFSHREITSSINKGFGKCLPQSFSVRRELFKFRTRKFKSFQNITYLSHSVIIFVKDKNCKGKHLYFQLCTCSRMCLLLNWQNCKL